VQQVAAIVSVVSMGVLIVIQLRQDVIALQTLSLTERIDQGALTSIELLLVWGLVGLGLYQLARMQRADPAETEVHGD